MAERPRNSLLGALTAGLNAIGTSLIFFLLVLLNADIGSRTFFDTPIRGVTEIVALSFVAIVYLQMPHSLRAGRLTVADTLFSRFARARPRAAHLAQAAYNLIGSVLFIVLFIASYPLFTEAWTRKLYVGLENSFTLQTWPVKLVILIGAAAMAAQFLALCVLELRAAFKPADRPRE